MGHLRTSIIGYDFSLRKKIPWNKVGGEIGKVILRSTGLSLDGYSLLPKETSVKVVWKLRFLCELIASWRRKYDRLPYWSHIPPQDLFDIGASKTAPLL
ncbi:MAG: hypothetical protein ACTSV6_06935 [Candidatus Heimdallarchaeota archaeon]